MRWDICTSIQARPRIRPIAHLSIPWPPACQGSAEGLDEFLHDARVVRVVHLHDLAGFEKVAPVVDGDLQAVQGTHDRSLDPIVSDDVPEQRDHVAPRRENMRARTAAILDAFDQHERSETEIAQRLMCDDLGCGD